MQRIIVRVGVRVRQAIVRRLPQRRYVIITHPLIAERECVPLPSPTDAILWLVDNGFAFTADGWRHEAGDRWALIARCRSRGQYDTVVPPSEWRRRQPTPFC